MKSKKTLALFDQLLKHLLKCNNWHEINKINYAKEKPICILYRKISNSDIKLEC